MKFVYSNRRLQRNMQNTDQPMAVENFSTEFYRYHLSGLVHENATEQIRPYN
jgi:hypothetical protein